MDDERTSTLVIAAVLVGVWLTAIACTNAAQQRWKEIDALLGPQVGSATRESIAEMWGAPTKRDTAGGAEFWTYYRDYGTVGSAVPVGRTVIARSHERFDNVVLVFRNGVLMKYYGDVQR